MTDAVLSYPNHTFLRVRATDNAAHDLDDRFTFQVKDAQHMPLVRQRMWDGKIHLYKINSGFIYRGLKNEVVDFLKDQGYEVDEGDDPVKPIEVEDGFIESLDLPFVPKDYQEDAFRRCLRMTRAVMLSPTASGKSLMIYMIARYLNKLGHRVLVIVPTINLVNQMAKDFSQYNKGRELSMHKILAGKEKNSKADIVISTWQSIVKMERSWFAQFGGVIGDEVHQYKAKSLVTIMESACDIPYRIGTTGTLDDIEENQLTIRGLFGDIFQTKKTSELIERGDVSRVQINMCTLRYNDETKRAFWTNQRDEDNKARRPTYPEEIATLLAHDMRFTFVTKLARALKGTTLILFRYKSHGTRLYEYLKTKVPNVHYVSGDVDGDDREAIRQLVMNNEGSVIVASLGVFSTGINIPNIDNIILAHPLKTKITLLQSIGRGLRLSEGKVMCNVYDVVDEVSTKGRSNYVFNHARERLKLYIREDFPVTHHTYYL